MTLLSGQLGTDSTGSGGAWGHRPRDPQALANIRALLTPRAPAWRESSSARRCWPTWRKARYERGYAGISRRDFRPQRVRHGPDWLWEARVELDA